VAQGWLAYDLTGSATFLGLVSGASALPGTLLMLPAGVVADRWDRRATLLYTNLVMAIASLFLTLIVAASVVEPWHLVVLAAIIGCASALNLPARQSLGPELVGSGLVANAVGLFTVSFTASRVLGPAVAGVLIAAIGLAGCFAFQTACMVVATGLTLPLAPDRKRTYGSMARSALQNVLDGIRFLASEPILRACTLIAAIHNLLAMAYSSLMPVFAADVFVVGAAGLGAMMAAAGVGSVLGAFATTALSHHKRKGVMMFGAAIALGAIIIGFAAAPSVPLAMAALAWIGGLSTVAMATCQTILNLALPDEFRGRVMSIYMMTWSLPQLTAPPLGWVADQVGAPATVAGSGGLFLGAMVLAVVWLSGLRQFRDNDFVRGRRERASAAT
jgi:MFS family permease